MIVGRDVIHYVSIIITKLICLCNEPQRHKGHKGRRKREESNVYLLFGNYFTLIGVCFYYRFRLSQDIFRGLYGNRRNYLFFR